MPKATIVLFSGDLDRAFAAFLIASRAAAEGWDVVMLFTFWGLSVIRDPNKKAPKKKEFAPRMFDMMMPKGANDLRLSRMHMLGLGTSMMKKRMSAKKLLTIREMIKEAKEFGVRFFACTVPMEIMGIQREEIIDEVDEFCSVGKYLDEAKNADVNLFI